MNGMTEDFWIVSKCMSTPLKQPLQIQGQSHDLCLLILFAYRKAIYPQVI